MAYLNEYPHVEPNKLNLDWLLEQYSTFNKRIAEILQHFDETVAQIRADFQEAVDTFENQLEAFESNIMGQFEAYRTLVNSTISTFETTVNHEVDSIRDVIEIVNENTEQYINENIQSFLWNVVTVTLEKSANVTAEGNATIHFDSYTIPEGYSSFVILEYSEQYQNVIWVGGNISPSTGVYPSLYYSKSGSNYNFTMNVYNPISEGSLDITAKIKLLLIPDSTMINE